MKKFTKLFLLTLCSFVAAVSFYKFNVQHTPISDVSVQIIESNSIEDVKKFAEPETLFIFDYDNVLVEGKVDYGFDAWFCAMLGELEKYDLPRAAAVRKLLPFYEKIQRTAEVQSVEPSTKNLISDLKQAGHTVMILTVRSLCLIDHVFRQLRSVEIDIEQNAIPENGINAELVKVGAKYVNGILFCDGYYKGPALKAFLQGNPNLKFKNIVFVDDKLKNVESVQSASQELGINFVGIRYGRTDERSKAYALDTESKVLAQKILQDSAPEVNRDVALGGTAKMLHV